VQLCWHFCCFVKLVGWFGFVQSFFSVCAWLVPAAIAGGLFRWLANLILCIISLLLLCW
jgi:hypothetical protein